MPRSLHSPGPRWPRARSLMLALATLLTVAAPATARADLCWLGMKARTGATAVVIDGVQAAGEWTGASSQGPAAGCVSRLLDGSPTNPAAVDATVYTMRDGSFLYFFFDVPDATTPKTSTSIGDFIILQIDPNHAVTTSLETGAGNRSHEHRFEFYTWRDAGGTGSTDQLLYFNSLPGAHCVGMFFSHGSHGSNDCRSTRYCAVCRAMISCAEPAPMVA